MTENPLFARRRLILTLPAAQHSVDRPPIPALLAIGAVHHHLIRTGLRTETSIVADTAQCVSTHQLAVMVGYGAHAVCPYLGFETARQWRSASRCGFCLLCLQPWP